jgi:hypothetical protein
MPSYHSPFEHLLILQTVPISAGVIVLSFVLAFSTFVRAFLAFIFELAWTYFVTSTRIYELWSDFKTDSKSLTESRKKHVRQMKEKAIKEKQARKEAKDARKEEEMRNEEAKKADLDLPRTAPNNLPKKKRVDQPPV